MKVFATALLVGLCATAFAGDRDKKEKPATVPTDFIHWAHSWEEAKAEAKERNVPIHVAFHKDHWGGCTVMDGSVYPNKDVIVASKTCVNIFCNDETQHEPKKKYGSEEWCEANYGQVCDEHVANHRATSSLYFKDSIPNPTSILCMPDGTEIKRKVGAATNKELIEMMKEASTKVGPGLGQDEYLLGKGKLKAADDAVAAGKIKDAIDALNASNKALAKNPAAKPVNDAVKAKLEEINKSGMDIIEKAKEDAAAGKVEEARKAMKGVYVSYKGLECAKAAEKEMAALPKDK